MEKNIATDETAEKNKEKPAAGAIIAVAPDGTLVSASSYKELAEKARAYREGR